MIPKCESKIPRFPDIMEEFWNTQVVQAIIC